MSHSIFKLFRNFVPDFGFVFGAGTLVLCLAGSSFCQAQLAVNSRYDTIVNYGDAAPLGGKTFASFSNVVMSGNGQWIGFESSLDPFGGVDQGIFRYSTTSNSLSLIIAENDALPGGTFNMSIGPRQLSANNAGSIAFNGFLSGTGGGTTDDTGIYVGSGGAVTQLAREGNTAPGGAGGTFLNFSQGNLDVQFRGINDLNQTFFQDVITNSPGAPFDDWRFFRAGTGAPEAIGVEGQAAPSGGNYATFSGYEMNDLGEAVVTGSTQTTNIGVKTWYMNSSGVMSELVTATNAGGGGTGTSVGNIRSTGGGVASINNVGDVVFTGWTNAGGTGNSDTFLFHTTTAGGTPTVLLAEDTAAPGGNGEFANIVVGTARLNDAGQYAAGLDLRGTTGGTADDSGIFRIDSNGSVAQMFREGQAALSGNGTFGALTGATSFAFNNSGNVAMLTNYVGTSGGAADNTAIVITDGIDYFEIAREGNVVGGNSVASLTFANGVFGNDRSTSGLNDFGQVAFIQNFISGNNRSIQLWTPDLHHRGGNSGFTDSSKWTLSVGPAYVHDVFMDSSTNSIVTALGMNTVNNLQVGGGTGTALLQLDSSAVVNVIDTLLLANNGSIALGANSILNLATLTGAGTISGPASSTINVSDLLSPGMSPGELSFSGTLSLGSNATMMIELGGLGLGQFDRVSGLSQLMIDGNLSVSLYGGFTLANGMDFTIFDVQGSSPAFTTGQFSGLGEGSLVGNFGGTNLYISYLGGNGNDVSLFASSVPEPSAFAAVAFALAGFVMCKRRRRGRV